MQTQERLLPATVQTIDAGGQVTLSRNEQVFEARLALPAPVQLVPGDEVLCMQDGQERYVIGLLSQRQDWSLQAAGELSISAGTGVTVQAPTVKVEADRLELLARRLFEKTMDSYRWAKGLAQTCVGRLRHLVQGHYHLRAERVTEQADKEVRIVGEHINLG